MTYTNVNSLSHIYWLIYCWHWTRVIRWCWHYLICLPHLTVSTTTCYWTGFGGQVHFIFVSPCSARTHIGGLFYTISGSVRSTAGIGPRANPIPSIHCWPAAVGEAPPTDSSCLRWRHTDLWVCWPADSVDHCEKVSVCVDEVSAWMASELQLNHAKTEVIWCTFSRRQH